MNMMQSVLPAYGLEKKMLRMEPFGTGLINRTWKIEMSDGACILQQVNDQVFQHPEHIALNTSLLQAYLKEHAPGYLFVAPLPSKEGGELLHLNGEGFFRVFPFVPGSHSKDVVQTPQQAFEAAVQFGRFTRLLAGFDVQQLKLTIPQFHDLTLRYEQFLLALEKSTGERRQEAQPLIQTMVHHSGIVTEYNRLKTDPDFKLRVTHHDTKISNVLFNDNNQGLCVIDLDTVMPGYFISDVGDMMRSYLSPVNEEEADFSKIAVREEFYKAIVEGYYSEMKDVLTESETGHFFYAGTFMTYMQALRFLTDYLNGDVYYGAAYPDHNLVRAGNQATLLQRLLEKEERLHKAALLHQIA